MKIRFADPVTCDNINEWLKSDIDNKTIILFLESGEVPKVYANDKNFENKYGIYFYDFGDVGMPDYKCVIKYNYLVFDYLTKVYGKRWKKEIRKDIIGLSKWQPDKFK